MSRTYLCRRGSLRLNDGKEKGRDKAGEDDGALRGNGGGIGVRVAVTDNLTLAAAVDADDHTEEDDGLGLDHARAAVSGKVSLGQFWGALSWSSHEAENSAGVTQADKEYVAGYVGMSFSDSTSGWVGYSQSETEGNPAEPSKIAAGLYHNMGGGLRLWYEGGALDKDVTGMDDDIKHFVGIRYDF